MNSKKIENLMNWTDKRNTEFERQNTEYIKCEKESLTDLFSKEKLACTPKTPAETWDKDELLLMYANDMDEEHNHFYGIVDFDNLQALQNMNLYVDMDDNDHWKDIFLNKYRAEAKRRNNFMLVSDVRYERIDAGIGQGITAKELQGAIDNENYDGLYGLLCRLLQYKIEFREIEELVSSEMPTDKFIYNHSKCNKSVRVSHIITYVDDKELEAKYHVTANDLFHNMSLFESFSEVKEMRQYENNAYQFNQIRQHMKRSKIAKSAWEKKLKRDVN